MKMPKPSTPRGWFVTGIGIGLAWAAVIAAWVYVAMKW